MEDVFLTWTEDVEWKSMALWSVLEDEQRLNGREGKAMLG
jgi:hypothetical protein